jgi:hypothetical protein
VCNFWQDIKYRPEPELQQFGGGTKVQGGGNVAMHGYAGGGGGGQPGYGPPPQGVPQYK